jgi:hypothetical protein
MDGIHIMVSHVFHTRILPLLVECSRRNKGERVISHEDASNTECGGNTLNQL